MRATWCLVAAAAIAVAIVALGPETAEASPGRSRSGGGRKKAGGWFSSGSKNRNNNNYGNSNYGNTYKKKGSRMKTLKKAAVIGAVAYGGYQLGKMSQSFGGWGWGRSQGYGFNDWNRWREVDGFLCRESSDCSWIDPRLYCQDYEFDFQPSALWFGGDVARIVGECACPRGMVFDDREMRCESGGFLSGGFTAMAALAIFLPLTILCCCCVAAAVIARKVFS